jgi:hypothetical protein
MQIAKLVTFMMLWVSTVPAHAQSADQTKKMAVTGAQLSGGIARIAADLCQIDQGLIAAYKERARKAYAADQNFEGDWIVGWNDQQHAVDDIVKLKIRSPDEYTLQKSETCAAISDEMKS